MKRAILAVLVTLGLVLQATTGVLAGTTGTITGTVVDATTNQPISGAKVTAQSPSQTTTTTADANGHYTFLSLNPDTYTLAVAGTTVYDAAAISGVTVSADTTQTVPIAQPQKLKVIGAVTSRANSSLVKPGTTADVYSISAVGQDKASALGGGGTLNSAWSAISSVPGVYVAAGLNGYIGAGASMSIRGGDYDQIGYELDGIPVNRAFDSYPSTSLSSLGQQELQVYTGAAPANSEAQGISGYINQVIRTGTAPASRNLTLAVGAPAFYNKGTFETGGANPSRTFSYYVGLGAYNQDYRYADQFNGASLSRYNGAPLATCPGGAETPTVNRVSVPSCYSPSGGDYTNTDKFGNPTTPAYVLGPYNYDAQSETKSRDSIVNLHFGLPRKDGNRDDIQVLYDNSLLMNYAYNSTNDAGGAAFLTTSGVNLPTYTDGYQVTAPYGLQLGPNYAGGGNFATTYLFPNSSTGRTPGGTIPFDLRDMTPNNQAIVKAQYQHNFGTNAFLRVYGYTYYSDWLQACPQSTWQNYLGFCGLDYELNAHTRGLSATFTDQITSKHLISVQGSYTASNVTRYNNSGIGFGASTDVGYLVSTANPYNGVCYDANGKAYSGCTYAGYPTAAKNHANFNGLTMGQLLGLSALTPYPAIGCGGSSCEYVLVAGGPSATYNQVQPKFYAADITDSWRPTDKLLINLGMRYDLYSYFGADTYNSPARTLFYNAYNLAHPATQLVNVPSQVVSFPEFQPRLGFTYTVDPSTVIRGSYGRYAQAPNSAFEQYNYLQPNDLSKLTAFGALGLGYTNGHSVAPEASNNYDLSFEHQFKGNVALKVTPFLRKTQDQIQQFYLDQKTSFVSGLNVGKQTSQGVELEVDKGDFSRNGFSGRFSFTYTNSYIKYTKTPNGSNVVDGINQIIQGYNAYTSYCANNPTNAKCGKIVTYDPKTNPVNAAACFTTGGAPDPTCAAGSIANPYWNAPVQGLLDPNGSYPTFDTFPAGIGSSYATYGAPYVSTILVQYKHDKLALTPAIQLVGGQRYGAPANLPGVSPDTCTAALTTATSTAGDPRYSYGSVGGLPYDATQCGDFSQAIPDPFTGKFHGLGQFVAPTMVQLHLQATYDVNKRVTLVGTFSNLYSNCFGGSKTWFTTKGACSYGLNYGQGGGINPIGNGYNPGDTLQPFLTVPYGAYFTPNPFNMYLEARIKM
ncbi:MAG: TonB-dependent receptor [Candidatus Eremiobacteraeota bacterium]|nr:TonB-dependent receptor [Candidatus Eremiobacteraeota bacterium]